MLVSEAGFGSAGAEAFQTLDILMAWQVEPVEVGGIAGDAGNRNHLLA
jgi:hypothetical protein